MKNEIKIIDGIVAPKSIDFKVEVLKYALDRNYKNITDLVSEIINDYDIVCGCADNGEYGIIKESEWNNFSDDEKLEWLEWKNDEVGELDLDNI